MTDKEKLDAIRAEIHRLVDVRGYDREMANDLFAFMDSLPNEPISEDLEETIDTYLKSYWGGDKEKQEWPFLKKMAIHFAEWQKQKDSIPVSEELEIAAKEWLRPQLDKSYANYGEAKMMELTRFDGYAMLDAIEFGAKWKEQQLEKNRLAACDKQTEEEAEIERDFVMGIIENEHRQPTFDDAIKYGMKLQEKQDQETIELAEDHAMLAGMEKMKEQMMAKAIDAHCFGFQGAALFSFRLPADNHLVGSEVKVIVIKED